MVLETDVQFISRHGWLEIFPSGTKIRRNGKITPLSSNSKPKLHIHEDGVTIAGLSPELIAWLKEAVKYEAEHDMDYEKRDPVMPQCHIAIRL